MEYNDYLKHWGILGMKWGQRNGPPYPLSKKQMNASERKQNNSKRVSDMTDDELDTKLKRLRKEDEYNRLIANTNKNSSDQGNSSELKKFVKKAVLTASLTGATWFIASASKDIGQAGYNYVKSFLKENGDEVIRMLKDPNYDLLNRI